MAKCSLTIMIMVAVGLGLVSASGCENHAQSGSAIGALMGAGIGQLAGHDSKSTVIGAAIGGATGYMLGNESDKRESQADITRLREQARYVTVNVTNSNGSISLVRLRRYGVGYVGTRGEYYNRLPTQDQLRPVYGF